MLPRSPVFTVPGYCEARGSGEHNAQGPRITGASQHFDRLAIERLRSVVIALPGSDVTKDKQGPAAQPGFSAAIGGFQRLP